MSLKRRGLRILVPIITFILAFLFVGCIGIKQKGDFTVSLDVGYGNQIEVGQYAPFKLKVTNNGDAFEGTLQLIVPVSEQSNVMIEKQLSLDKNSEKTVVIVAPVEVAFHRVKVNMCNKKNQVIWNEMKTCSVTTNKSIVKIGILSDDYGACGYMDRQRIWGTSSMSTRIFELNDDDFEDDWHALEPLDVIVISDFSTDLLSDNQIIKLSLWVDNGGLLIIGTGSTSKKTLAKTNGTLFTITPGELKQRNTRFGTENISYYSASDAGATHVFSNELPIDSDYSAFFPEYYEEYKDGFVQLYGNAFKNEYYITDDEFNEQNYQESFYSYCYEMYYYDYYLALKQSENQDDINKTVTESDYAKADLLDFTWEDAYKIQASTSSNELFDFASFKEYGSGVVLVCSADFTKNPLASYKSNSIVFMNLINTTIGTELIYEESNSSSSKYSYGYYGGSMEPITTLSKDMISAVMPPVIIYFSLLIMYLFALPIVWVVLKRKKKTIKLWIAFPITALATGLLIYCLGFSTRVSRPVVNTLSVSQQFENSKDVRSIVGVTVPKNKNYRVGFADRYSLDMLGLISTGAYYFDESAVDYDNYDLAICQTASGTEVRIEGTAALEGNTYKLQHTSFDAERVDVKYEYINSKIECTVTNNYSCTLKDSFVYILEYVYYIGDLKPGETVKISDESKVKMYKVENDIDGLDSIPGVFRDNNKEQITMNGVLGSLAPNYYDSKLKEAALRYFVEAALGSFGEDAENSMFTRTAQIDRNNDPGFWFIAFPSEGTESCIQEGTKCREHNIEMIAVYKSQREIREELMP